MLCLKESKAVVYALQNEGFLVREQIHIVLWTYEKAPFKTPH